ncbi:hypothetical protein [Marinimicrobium agarilyticum]|uniref:hypothetical protein n=1 Tax=Marinimicrobium agarilyticum TaxID=306546 RepID=UPI00040B35EE|nr:hypothetical protein [Marinimicrobium agarilyticum]
MFEQEIASIVADRESGSSQLVARIQRALFGLESSQPDRQQLQWAFQQLRHVDQSMVVVHHLLEELEPSIGSGFFEALRDYERHWSDLPRRVAARLIEARNWDDSHVLVHSHSGMLLEAIRRVTERYRGLTIWQTRSDPGGEGLTQYRELQDQGVMVHMVEDSQVPELAASMSAAWLGVDQYNDRAFVNKLGSKRIAEEMSRAGNTTFVLGDPRKRVDTLDFSSTLFEAVPFTGDTCLIEGEPYEGNSISPRV